MTKITKKIVIIVIYSPTYLTTLNKLLPDIRKTVSGYFGPPSIYLSFSFLRTLWTSSTENFRFYTCWKTDKFWKTKNSFFLFFLAESDKISIKTQHFVAVPTRTDRLGRRALERPVLDCYASTPQQGPPVPLLQMHRKCTRKFSLRLRRVSRFFLYFHCVDTAVWERADKEQRENEKRWAQRTTLIFLTRELIFPKGGAIFRSRKIAPWLFTDYPGGNQ